MRDALILYQEKCADLGITVQYKDEFADTIQADSALLGQVIENMLKNSIEAQPDGGWISIGTRRQGRHYVLSIENPGFNLSAPDLKNIVEPYFTTKTKGTGLGLDVCRRIVKSHGGDMKLEVPAEGILKIIVAIPVVQQMEKNK